MKPERRIYDPPCFLVMPRGTGKTTLARAFPTITLDVDDIMLRYTTPTQFTQRQLTTMEAVSNGLFPRTGPLLMLQHKAFRCVLLKAAYYQLPPIVLVHDVYQAYCLTRSRYRVGGHNRKRIHLLSLEDALFSVREVLKAEKPRDPWRTLAIENLALHAQTMRANPDLPVMTRDEMTKYVSGFLGKGLD